jgi:integrase
MVRINFNLRDSAADSTTPVNVVIRWNGQRLVYPSGERIAPDSWSIKTQRAKKGVTGSGDFNLHLTNVQQGIEKAYRSAREKYLREPSIAELRAAIDAELTADAAAPELSFLDFVQQFINGADNRINPVNGKSLAHTTKKKYHSTYAHLKEFLKNHRKPVQCADIDLQFYERFNTYLTITKKLALNSVGKYIQTLKTFLRAADELGMVVNSAYKSRRFKVPKEDTTAVYLADAELDELFSLDLSNRPALERARDLMVFHCRTGLRHSDWNAFSEINFSGDRIQIRTQKTSQIVTIPLHYQMTVIRSRYEGVYPNSLPPALTNQKMNEYLKELAAIAPSLQMPVIIYKTVGGVHTSITKKKFQCITTHTARRSFATNLYRAGCPVRSIMEITGHKSESSFRSYIRLNGEEHAQIVEMFMNGSAAMHVAR